MLRSGVVTQAVSALAGEGVTRIACADGTWVEQGGCELVICAVSACLNGGVCNLNTTTSFVTCECLPGWAGAACEVALWRVLPGTVRGGASVPIPGDESLSLGSTTGGQTVAFDVSVPGAGSVVSVTFGPEGDKERFECAIDAPVAANPVPVSADPFDPESFESPQTIECTATPAYGSGLRLRVGIMTADAQAETLSLIHI